MARYLCERCGQTNPHGISSGMCSPCLSGVDGPIEPEPTDKHDLGNWLQYLPGSD